MAGESPSDGESGIAASRTATPEQIEDDPALEANGREDGASGSEGDSVNTDSDEEDEDENQEVTEEDRRFVAADDEEVEEDEEARRVARHERRRRLEALGRAKRAREEEAAEASQAEKDGDRVRRRPRTDDADGASDAAEDDKEDEELDEDDLELVRENMEREKRQTEHRRAGDAQSRGVDDLFAAEEENARRDSDEDSFIEDDEDDFVEADEEAEAAAAGEADESAAPDLAERSAEAQRARRERLKQRRQFAADIGAELGISDRTWNDIREIFGDGTDYEDILALQEMQLQGGTTDELPRDDDDEEEADEDDDGVPRRRARKGKQQAMERVFEPAAIKERLMTEEDEQIRAQDVPERFLTRSVFAVPAEGEIAHEAEWISRKLLLEREVARFRALGPAEQADTRVPTEMDMGDAPVAELAETVQVILGFVRELQLEIPCIVRFRRDYYNNLLSVSELWRIYDLDEAWQALEVRRRRLAQVWDQVCAANAAATAADAAPVRGFLEAAASAEELNDVDQLLRMRYATEMQTLEPAGDGEQRRYKRRLQLSAFEALRGRRAMDFVAQFGVDTRQYARSYSDGQQHEAPADASEAPLDAARAFGEAGLEAPERILAAARAALVVQLASEPLVRATIRRFIQQDACLTVHVTEQGRREIDAQSVFAPIKYLRQKPLKELGGTDYVYVRQAESLGLVTTEIRVMMHEEFMEDALMYISSGTGSLWDEERRTALRTAIETHILPQVTREMRYTLGIQGEERVLEEVRERLQQRIHMQPFGAPIVADSNRQADLDGAARRRGRTGRPGARQVRVLALTWGEGDSETATVGILMTASGEQVVDTIKLDHLQSREESRFDSDLARLREFMQTHEPDGIVVAGFTPLTRRLYDIVDRLVNETFANGADEYNTREDEADGSPSKVPPQVLLLDDDVARVFMNSEAGERQFPHLPPLMRYCVALCRKALDPLSMYASLATLQREIAQLQFHECQGWVSADRLHGRLERAFINEVARVGVDLLECVHVEWKQGLLQFVAGLGARKAAVVVAKAGSAEGGSGVESREDFIRLRMMGARTFSNCAGFLRIRRRHFAGSEALRVDVLDNMLVQPEDYDFPRKMASDALDIEDDGNEDENPSEHVEALLRQRAARKLDTLELDDFAAWLRQTRQVEKLLALGDIRLEVQRFDEDQRPPFRGAAPDEVFSMLTGASVNAYREGTRVTCAVARVVPAGLVVRLERGLSGFVPRMQTPMAMGADELDTVYQPGQPLEARVESLDIARLQLALSVTPEALAQPATALGPLYPVASGASPLAPDLRYWDHQAEERDAAALQQERQAAMQRPTRNIHHPLYRDIPNFRAACAYLVEHGNMQYLIRPSGSAAARGAGAGAGASAGRFVITWRVFGDVFVHIEMAEIGQSVGRGAFSDTNQAQGEFLVNGKTYTGFDEIHARLMQPLLHYVALLLNHPKFHRHPLTTEPAGREITRGFLEQTYHAGGGRMAVYRLCCDDTDDMATQHKAVPGRFLLGVKFHRDRPPAFLPVGVTDAGYVLQGAVYPTVDALIEGFKKAFASGPPPGVAPRNGASRPASSRPQRPSREPSRGGSSRSGPPRGPPSRGPPSRGPPSRGPPPPRPSASMAGSGW